uniref:Nudix hydrolase domain-containing protein n=1 Tax=Oryza punctata TaxID=4537 RepID=A0A0E0LUE8_ORYPU
MTISLSHPSPNGEVALPGGKAEEGDADDAATALREAQEEIGLDSALVTVVASLEHFLSKHLLIVVPVIGILSDIQAFKPVINVDEVDTIFDVPLEMFLKDEKRTSEEREWMGQEFTIHYFNYEKGSEKYVIWGLTAGILIHTASVVFQRPPDFPEQRVQFNLPNCIPAATRLSLVKSAIQLAELQLQLLPLLELELSQTVSAPSKLGVELGEVALPGGKAEEGDADDAATALREAKEEIGLDPSLVTVVASLEHFLSKHLLVVVPIVGILSDIEAFKPVLNVDEVDDIFDVPLEMFLKDENRTSEEREKMGQTFTIHYFNYEKENQKYLIWGLTARILIHAASVVYQRPPDFPERRVHFNLPKF